MQAPRVQLFFKEVKLIYESLFFTSQGECELIICYSFSRFPDQCFLILLNLICRKAANNMHVTMLYQEIIKHGGGSVVRLEFATKR